MRLGARFVKIAASLSPRSIRADRLCSDPIPYGDNIFNYVIAVQDHNP